MLAHANAQTIRYSLKNNTITYFNESDVDWSSAIDYQCPDCLIGKSTKHRHIKGSRLKYQNSYEPFQYLHTDIFGPVHNLPKSAPSYFISFTDETTKFRWVYPLHDRREDSILDVFTTILAFIKTSFRPVSWLYKWTVVLSILTELSINSLKKWYNSMLYNHSGFPSTWSRWTAKPYLIRWLPYSTAM